MLPAEIITLYQTSPGDWRGLDRDSECDRISAGLGQVMLLAEWKPFASAFDLNLCPYPVDLVVVKKRLDNRFYRRASAVQFDVRYVYTNARIIYGAESVVLRSALFITELCLEIIKNPNAVIPTINDELVEKYTFRDEGTDVSGPSTSRAGAERITRSRSISQMSDSESEEDSPRESRNGVDTSKSKVISCPN